ncbi:cysteine peptidase family C39 domain-containing protein, partial [Candidatus Omnitrophota bacterium]
MKKLEPIGPQIQPEIEEAKPPFKSGFKAWIRVVALIILMVFLPEQVAQAVQYDFSMLRGGAEAATGTFLPQGLNAPGQINIPLAVKRILNEVSGKPINAIQISPTLTLKLDKPLNLSKGRVEEIYNWLEGKPCGSKALYDFLAYRGINASEQDIAVLALSIDILNGVIKPQGDPKVIKNSLYALSKVAEFFGNKLYPAILNDPKGSIEQVAPAAPFIAHLKGDHYVLVTHIANDKVYFIDQHKEEFWPLDKFLVEFSGYILSEVKGLAPLAEVSEEEAKLVMGARSYKGQYPDLSPLFWKPSWKDALISMSMSVAGTLIGGGGASALAKSIAISNVGQSVTYLAASLKDRAGDPIMSPGWAQFTGSVVACSLSGIDTVMQSPDKGHFKADWMGNKGFGKVWNNTPVLRGVTMGALQGATVGGMKLWAYEKYKNESGYHYNEELSYRTINYFSNILGTMLFSGITSFAGFQQGWKMKNDIVKVGERPGDFGGFISPFKYGRMSSYAITEGLNLLWDKIEYDTFVKKERERYDSRLVRDPELKAKMDQEIYRKWLNNDRFLSGLGKSFLTGAIGGFGGSHLSANKQSWYQVAASSVWSTALEGLVEWRLREIKDDNGKSLITQYERGEDGVYRNKLGLTRLETNLVLYSLTSSIKGLTEGTIAAISKRNFKYFLPALGASLTEDTTTMLGKRMHLGFTDAQSTHGDIGAFTLYNEKLGAIGGYGDFARNADLMMLAMGYLKNFPALGIYYAATETPEKLREIFGRDIILVHDKKGNIIGGYYEEEDMLLRDDKGNVIGKRLGKPKYRIVSIEVIKTRNDVWRDFVNDGYLHTLFPSLTSAMVEYDSSILRSSAIENIGNILEFLPGPFTLTVGSGHRWVNKDGKIVRDPWNYYWKHNARKDERYKELAERVVKQSRQLAKDTLASSDKNSDKWVPNDKLLGEEEDTDLRMQWSYGSWGWLGELFGKKHRSYTGEFQIYTPYREVGAFNDSYLKKQGKASLLEGIAKLKIAGVSVNRANLDPQAIFYYRHKDNDVHVDITAQYVEDRLRGIYGDVRFSGFINYKDKNKLP